MTGRAGIGRTWIGRAGISRTWLGTVMLAILLFACGTEENGGLKVTDGWARQTTRDQVSGVAYFVIENSSEVDRLIGIETDIAERAMLHLSETVEGVSRMHPMSAVAIPTGVPVVLGPGGLHVMLVGLTEQLRVGESFELTLVFERAGRVDVEIDIKTGS